MKNGRIVQIKIAIRLRKHRRPYVLEDGSHKIKRYSNDTVESIFIIITQKQQIINDQKRHSLAFTYLDAGFNCIL